MIKPLETFMISLLSLLMLFMTTIVNANAAQLKFNTQEFAPFNYTIDGKVSGPVVEIINTACNEANIQCPIRSLPWRRAQKMVKQGKAHALFVIGRNKAREKWLHFSCPIMETEYGFFVKKDNSLKYSSPKDIEGYTIGVYGPSNTSHSLTQLVKKSKNTKIEITPDDESGFRKTSFKHIDAVFSNRDVGHALIAKIGIKNLRYAGAHKKLKYYIGFSKKNTDQETLNRFNAAYRKLHKRGTTREILSRYQMKSLPCK